MSNSERSERNLSNKKISFIQQQIPKQSMITQEQPQHQKNHQINKKTTTY